MARAIFIVFPRLDIAVHGGPDMVRLTPAEATALHRIHLGGMAALRTPTYRVATRTVDSLVQKGLLGRDGPTELGRRTAEGCAQNPDVCILDR
jgi:hypothetical protein